MLSQAEPFQDWVNLQRLIATVEFNLMPLQHNLFTNCKSELKYFEAAAVGTLSIASPSANYVAAIRDGDNGYLSRAHDWAQAMQAAIQQVDSYADMARRAHLDAIGKYAWPQQAPKILRALGEGDAVGILIDQNTAPAEGVFIDFFGRKACAGTAFVKFAHHTGAAVVPGYALWSDQEKLYVLRFDPEVPMTGEVQADTQRVHSALETVIREHPDQWLWIHRRWKTRPPGEPGLY